MEEDGHFDEMDKEEELQLEKDDDSQPKKGKNPHQESGHHKDR